MTGSRSTRRLLWSIISLAVFAATAGTSVAKGPPVTEAAIKALLQICVDGQHRAPGIVVGVVDDHGTKIVGYGKRERDKPAPVNGDTLFEIGSVTKVFTTLLMQDMADHKEVKLDDPIGKYLPQSVKTPTRDGKQITLLDLATHTSGLPDAPDNFHPSDGDDPWASYTVAQMYDFLSQYALTRAIGTTYEYSNVGMGLLGHILALKAGTSYESLLVGRVCDPLQMKSTRLTLNDEMKMRLAHGHAECGVPVVNWTSNALQGDGALFSSVNDMVKFLAANMGKLPSPLCTAMKKTQQPLRDAVPFLKLGLGWHVCSALGVNGLVWHNGATGGYRSFIGFDPDTRRGAVVLANGASDIDDIGVYLTGTSGGLEEFETPRQREVARNDPAVFDRYVGRYKFKGTGDILTVTRNGNHLYATESGIRYRVLPESESEFFFTAVDAQFSFVKDTKGDFTHVISHRDGKDEKGERIK
jgi:D-alanyl-D-alanine-carboxypeptidase/D-alanyl-D-alanine-endopeptidase